MADLTNAERKHFADYMRSKAAENQAFSKKVKAKNPNDPVWRGYQSIASKLIAAADIIERCQENEARWLE